MDLQTAEARVLDAAATLFYARGVHAVGMDDRGNIVYRKRLSRPLPSRLRRLTQPVMSPPNWFTPHTSKRLLQKTSSGARRLIRRRFPSRQEDRVRRSTFSIALQGVRHV